MPAFALLLGNIWFRRAALAVVVTIALLGVRQHYINMGNRQGHTDEAQQTAKQGAADVAVSATDTRQQLAVLQVQVDAANKQANTLTALLLSLQGQRAAASNSLSQLSDSQVRALIRQELGDKSGSNAPLTPKEERSCAAAIQNADFCEKQRQAESDRADAEKKRADGIKAQYLELAPYTIFMEKSYTQLFNEKSTPEKSWKCLKLWRCKKAKIKAPDPKSLIRPAIVDPK